MFKNFLQNASKCIRENKTEFILFFIVIAVSAFLRLYRIDEYMTFLGDEGRDVILVRRFLVYGDIFLIGPGTSIGNMYLGPLYYYMIAPALWLFNYSPVGPAVQVAVLGILTTALVWWVGKEWFGKSAGLIAAFLYAISPTVIIYSRSSWNPNIMPFFALLCVYGMWRIIRKDTMWWLPVVGISFAFVMQSHYLGLLLLPTLSLMWFFALWLHNRERKSLVVFTSIAAGIFGLLMSPLVIFDYRHGWINAQAIKVFFTERQTTVSARPWNAIPDLWPITQEIITRVLAGKNEEFGAWVAALLAGGVIYVVYRQRKKLNIYQLLVFAILLVWFGIALLGFGLYKQEIYDHYFGFVFPVPFLLLGGVSYVLIKTAKLRGSWIVATVLVFLVFYNLADNPLRYSPNKQLQRSVSVVQKIQEESQGAPYNLAVIAERNYEDAYQYFSEKWGDPVVDIDPQNTDETITDQLFVICELPAEKCDPTHNPKTEIANFGWSEIEKQWEVSGVILYKLIHTE